MKKPSKLLLAAGIGLIVLGLGTRLLLAEWVESILGIIAVGLLSVFGSVFTDYRFYKEIASMKTTKNGLSLGAVVAMVFVLLSAVNYISHVRNITWDLTSEKLNSLSDQTVTVLNNVKSEIEFRGFFRPGIEGEDRQKDLFEALVKMYQAQSPKVKLFTFDPFKRKDLADKFKVLTTGEISISIGDKQTTVSDVSEQAFTNAIVKLTRNSKSLYSLSGHGERDLEETGPRGLSQFKTYLVDEGYKIEALNLATSKGKIPEDAAVLIIAGPVRNFAGEELKMLHEFLSKGGKLFLALDPGTHSNATKISIDVGVEFYNQFIIDFLGRMLVKSAGVAVGRNHSATHEVTSKIRKMETFFNLASAVRRAPGAFAGITTEDLVATDQTAFLAKNLDGELEDQPKQNFTVAIASKGKISEAASRDFAAVVVGDSDFVTNESIDVYGANRDLALNIVASLSNDAEMITIRPKIAQGTPFVLTTAENGGFLGLVLVVPVLLFGFGLLTWWRRRGA